MSQDVSRARAVRYQAIHILALGYVLPKTLHSSTMWRDGTLAVLMLARACMTQ